MTTVAWGLLGLGLLIPLYAYAGYPAILWLLSRFRTQSSPREAVGEWPPVTITVPVFNEERSIGATLDALLAVDYPRDRVQILVISDASSDRTDEIVRTYEDRGVQLIRLPQRGGKTAAENAGREYVHGDIVVNTDATIRIDRQGIKALVSCFADPTVGVASGRDVSIARRADDVNVGESRYVGYEMRVRDLETRVHGIVGASGCFFAVRRELHMEIVPEALSRDFVAPLIARENGYRSISANDAVCYVPRTGSLVREYRRKVRTMTRGLETLFYKRDLLNPFRYGIFAWMLFSHKLTRWLVPWAVILGGVGTATLAVTHGWARWLFLGGLAAILLAVIGWFWPAGKQMPRVFAAPTYLGVGIVAGLSAWIRAMRRELDPIWEPTRREEPTVRM